MAVLDSDDFSETFNSKFGRGVGEEEVGDQTNIMDSDDEMENNDRSDTSSEEEPNRHYLNPLNRKELYGHNFTKIP